jgi:hypothetical protein
MDGSDAVTQNNENNGILSVQTHANNSNMISVYPTVPNEENNMVPSSPSSC